MDKEIKTSTFSSALAYEKMCQPRADRFLQEKYPDKNIRRPDYRKGGQDKELQLADVDVVVSNKEGWPNEWYISEKFRSKPWPDILVEFWSNYDDKKPGWAFNTISHEHYIYYNDARTNSDGEITKDYSFLRIVPTWAIKRAAQTLKPFIDPIAHDMYMSGVCHRRVELMGYHVTVIINKTFGSDNEVLYFSVAAAIDMQYFKDINANITEIKTAQYAVNRSTDTEAGNR